LEASQSHTDHELFYLIAEGNEDAFRMIFHKYNRKLYPFIFAMVKSETDAKEVLQEVFLKLWLQRESLTTIDNPGAWLHTVANNATYDLLRAQSRYALRIKNSPQPGAAADTTMEELDAKFTKALIDEAVEQLPAKRRQVFTMARMEGMTRREIALELNISENTVRNQLAAAMDSVQDYLSQKGVLLAPFLIFLLK
jgi:RNA polymerase sigma-70 factor (family 1)